MYNGIQSKVGTIDLTEGGVYNASIEDAEYVLFEVMEVRK
jgi:hypothetical protein